VQVTLGVRYEFGTDNEGTLSRRSAGRRAQKRAEENWCWDGGSVNRRTECTLVGGLGVTMNPFELAESDEGRRVADQYAARHEI